MAGALFSLLKEEAISKARQEYKLLVLEESIDIENQVCFALI
jgi:hypothetical protein